MTSAPAHDEFAHELAVNFPFAEEMKVVRQLQHKCEDGRRLVNAIYCSRSCARAFPPVVAGDAAEPTRSHSYYQAIFTVLQPQVAKIRQLSDFCAQAVVLLSDNIQRITVHENMTRVIPDAMMDALLDVLDVVLQLNHLHDTKSSLRNDFSVFKRAFLHIRDTLPDAEQVEKDIVRLQEFVGSSSQSKGTIWDSLRHNLTNVKRYDQVTYLLLKHCVTHVENDICTTPHQKFKYIRALSYLLAVLEEADGWKKTVSLPGADKKVIEVAIKLLGRFPVVPMFAEISMTPMRSLLSQAGGKVDLTTGTTSSKHRDALFDIVAVSRESTATCEDYLPRLIHALNLVRAILSILENTDVDHGYTQEQNAGLYCLLVEGVGHLNKWKSSFSLFLALKYQNPKPSEVLRAEGVRMNSPFLEYERVTKHNYSGQEWRAMADIIYSVKSVVQILRRFHHKLVTCVRRSVYQQVQVFVQHTLLPILHRADKRKLGCTKLLHDLRMMCGDWIDSGLLSGDFKKKRGERRLPEIRDRIVSPSLCQIQMLRTAVDSIYTKRSMGDLNGKSSGSSALFSFKKDLDSADVEALQEFYRDAGAFPAMLNVDATLHELADFSSIWFRELYLELAKSVQIPTEISLPWLLIHHCLSGEGSHSSRVESVLSILDIYNDAASRSLYGLRQQWLYDEVEAEGKLCFDHFTFRLAERIYMHYKTVAAVNITRGWSRGETQNDKLRMDRMPISGKSNSNQASGDDTSFVCDEPSSRYDPMLSQKRVGIFGKTYDLSLLLGQRVSMLLRRDVDSLVSKIETSDATCYVAMVEMLKLLKHTHASLSALTLDDFEDLVGEANDERAGYLIENSPSAECLVRSRIHDHISRDLLEDLFQHFSANFERRRFIRTALHPALVLTVGNQAAHEDCLRKTRAHRGSKGSMLDMRLESQAAKYSAVEKCITRGYRSFFGEPHIEALIELLPARELFEVANECIEFALVKIEDVLALCIPALGSAIPPFRLPRFMYRTEGCYGYFEGKFKHLLGSDELEAQVFHCLREIGNALLFLLLLENAMGVRAIQTDVGCDFHTPDPQAPIPERPVQIFQYALAQIAGMLQRSGIAAEWEASAQSQPDKMPNASSFYHVWSALEFLSCKHPQGDVVTTSSASTLSLRDMFGDGVQLAGCTLVHLLGQRTLYELWNVSQHVLNVHHQEQIKIVSTTQAAFTASSKKTRHKDSTQSSVGTLDKDMEDKAARFVTSARNMRATSSHIFHMLETLWPLTPPPSNKTTPPAFTAATTPPSPPSQPL